MAGKLYIDVGNTRLKWRFDQGSMESMIYASGQLPSQLDVAWGNQSAPDNVWMVAVATTTVLQQLHDWISNNWELVPCAMTVSVADCGVSCGYNQPQQLGADRWAALIATYAAFPEGAVVVDCGTAVTVDAVNAEGQHLGGFILPGITTMQQSLSDRTAMQWIGRDTSSHQEWGNDTASCIGLGTCKAVAALVEQSIERLQANGVCDPALVITGGDAELLQPFLEIDSQRRDALVLEGLRLYALEKKT